MISVNVFSEEKAWSKRLKNKSLFFKKVCNSFPKKYKFLNKNVTFSLLLSNNKNIKILNRNFRNKNKSTDILSFPLNEKFNIKKKIYLGDIIISYNFIDKPKSQDLKLFKKKAKCTKKINNRSEKTSGFLRPLYRVLFVVKLIKLL